MPVTVRHMRIFLEVYRQQNITHAAQILHMTQPAVTRAIQELERYYGARLFERMNRRLAVTESGRLLYGQALHIVESFDQLERGLRDWDQQGVLRVGSSVTLGTFLMPALAAAFQGRRPGVRLRVQIANGGALERLLRENELDLALIEGPAAGEDLRAERFSGDVLVPVLPPGHPLLARKALCLADVLACPLLLREPGSAGRAFLDHVLAAHGLTAEPAWESISTQAILQAVSAGLGVSFLPEKLVRAPAERGLVATRSLSDEAFSRSHYMVWHKNKHLTASALDLMDLCRHMGAEA